MLYKVPMRAVQGENGLGYNTQHRRELEWNSMPRNSAPPRCYSGPRPTQDGKEQHKLHSILVELEAHGFGVEDGADKIPLGRAEPCRTGRRWHADGFIPGLIAGFTPHGFIPGLMAGFTPCGFILGFMAGLTLGLCPMLSPVRVTTASTSLPV